MAAKNRSGKSGAAYTQGKSGYSKKDEQDAKNYSEGERLRSKDSMRRGYMPQSEVDARTRTSEKNYLSNTKSERGRAYNKSNMETISKDLEDVNGHKWKGTM